MNRVALLLEILWNFTTHTTIFLANLFGHNFCCCRFFSLVPSLPWSNWLALSSWIQKQSAENPELTTEYWIWMNHNKFDHIQDMDWLGSTFFQPFCAHIGSFQIEMISIGYASHIVHLATFHKREGGRESRKNVCVTIMIDWSLRILFFCYVAISMV